jgi:hypothetical protein
MDMPYDLINPNIILHKRIYTILPRPAVFVLDKMAGYGYYITVGSEQLHVSIGDTAGFSLPRVRPYFGCKLFLEEAPGIRMDYLCRNGPPPCGW